MTPQNKTYEVKLKRRDKCIFCGASKSIHSGLLEAAKFAKWHVEFTDKRGKETRVWHILNKAIQKTESHD